MDGRSSGDGRGRNVTNSQIAGILCHVSERHTQLLAHELIGILYIVPCDSWVNPTKKKTILTHPLTHKQTQFTKQPPTNKHTLLLDSSNSWTHLTHTTDSSIPYNKDVTLGSIYVHWTVHCTDSFLWDLRRGKVLFNQIYNSMDLSDPVEFDSEVSDTPKDLISSGPPTPLIRSPGVKHPGQCLRDTPQNLYKKLQRACQVFQRSSYMCTY